MKKILIGLLITVVALGALAGAGMAGFKVGYAKGVMTSTNGDAAFMPFQHGNHSTGWKHHGSDDGSGKQNKWDDKHSGKQFYGRGHGRGISHLAHLALLALILWVVYQVFNGNGWHLSLVRHQPQAMPASTESQLEESNTATEAPKKSRSQKSG